MLLSGHFSTFRTPYEEIGQIEVFANIMFFTSFIWYCQNVGLAVNSYLYAKISNLYANQNILTRVRSERRLGDLFLFDIWPRVKAVHYIPVRVCDSTVGGDGGSRVHPSPGSRFGFSSTPIRWK